MPRRKMLAVPALAALALAAPPRSLPAAPPAEVARVRLAADVLDWTPAAGATHYNVYRGTAPWADDHVCFMFRTAATTAAVTEPAPPTRLHYFLVSAVNADGEGSLGRRGAAVVPNPLPCDGDNDLVRDEVDNCPTVANPSQADQDRDGRGDRCDPRTYDFEADLLGARPAEMETRGGADPSLAVRDTGAGDLGVAYDGSGAWGIHDQFTRLQAGMSHQDTTVYIDYQDAPESLSIELWSDGTATWNAGSGLILQIDPAGTLLLFERDGSDVPVMVGPPGPPSGRIRARLVKGAGSTSRLSVDAWDGTAWLLDHAVFTIADDHRHRGLETVLGNWRGGLRALRRLTVVHIHRPEPFVLRQHPSWSADWKLYQRDARDQATVPVRFDYRLDEPARVQARVVWSATRIPLTGHDWADNERPLPAAPEGSGQIDVAGVPAGGNYDLEVRLLRERDSAVIGGGFLAEIAVGDLYLTAGQSNMAGWSGTLAGAEPPIDAVHLFHNDGTWTRAMEPMDDITDQVDKVSREGAAPQHSPMLRFAKDVYAATGIPVGVIPAPLGGSNLFVQWQRDSADPANRGTLYGSAIHRVRLQELPEPPRGVLWFQGESDVYGGRSTADYLTDLERLVAELRSDLGHPGLAFIAAQLGTEASVDLDAWLGIQEAQRLAAAADPAVALITTVDQPRADSIHFNVDGYKEIGARFARAAREIVYEEPVAATLALVAVRAGAGGLTVEVEHDGDVAGGAPSLFRVDDSGGRPAILAVSTAGRVVTLTLERSLLPPAVVSYGYDHDPAAPWLVDARGVAVPCFHVVRVAP